MSKARIVEITPPPIIGCTGTLPMRTAPAYASFDLPANLRLEGITIHKPDGTRQRLVPARPAAIPNQRTKVGDRVRVCYNTKPGLKAVIIDTTPVLATCQWRGVYVRWHGWCRSWVRVKGGAQ